MAKKDEPETPDADRPGGGGERARAAAYLDLWERQVTHAALHGPAPVPPKPPREAPRR